MTPSFIEHTHTHPHTHPHTHIHRNIHPHKHTHRKLKLKKIVEPNLMVLPIKLIPSDITKGGRGHWAVYYSSPQSFIVTFSYLLTTLGTFVEF